MTSKSRIKSILLIFSLLSFHFVNSQSSVSIYTQVWSTSNLNTTKFRNGDPIPEVKSAADWIKAGKDGKPAWCYYNNDPANGTKYGKLYNWFAVMDPRGIAPAGWHIPTLAEVKLLVDTLGFEERYNVSGAAGRKLKSTSGWKENGGGSNQSGFNGLPGGFRDDYNGMFTWEGIEGKFWTSTPSKDIEQAHSWSLAVNTIESSKICGFAIRLIRDPNPWMTSNLSVDRFRNGDIIPEAKTNEDWDLAGIQGLPAWCWYNNDPSSESKYGKLYNYFAVIDPRGLAPKGWHIPSDAEWTTLLNYLGGDQTAAPALKNTTGWSLNRNGNNRSGLAFMPGGSRHYTGKFDFAGTMGMFWSTTEGKDYKIWYRIIHVTDPSVGRFEGVSDSGFSVRCVRDQ